MTFPTQILTGGREPSKLVAALADTTAGVPLLPTQALGRVSENGAVSVLVSQSCTVTIWYYNKAVAGWRPGGVQSTDYALTFAHANGGLGYFNLPVGALFFLTSDTGTTQCLHDGCDVGSI